VVMKKETEKDPRIKKNYTQNALVQCQTIDAARSANVKKQKRMMLHYQPDLW
jgi:hypothetical protein